MTVSNDMNHTVVYVSIKLSNLTMQDTFLNVTHTTKP